MWGDTSHQNHKAAASGQLGTNEVKLIWIQFGFLLSLNVSYLQLIDIFRVEASVKPVVGPKPRPRPTNTPTTQKPAAVKQHAYDTRYPTIMQCLHLIVCLKCMYSFVFHSKNNIMKQSVFCWLTIVEGNSGQALTKQTIQGGPGWWEQR